MISPSPPPSTPANRKPPHQPKKPANEKAPIEPPPVPEGVLAALAREDVEVHIAQAVQLRRAVSDLMCEMATEASPLFDFHPWTTFFNAYSRNTANAAAAFRRIGVGSVCMEVAENTRTTVWPRRLANEEFKEQGPKPRELQWASREEDCNSPPVMVQFGPECDPSNPDCRVKAQQLARIQGFEVAAFLDTPTSLEGVRKAVEFHACRIKHGRIQDERDCRPVLIIVDKEIAPDFKGRDDWACTSLSCISFGIDSNREYWVLQPLILQVPIGMIHKLGGLSLSLGWSRGSGRIGSVSRSWMAKEASMEYGYEASTFPSLTFVLNSIPATVLEYLGLCMLVHIRRRPPASNATPDWIVPQHGPPLMAHNWLKLRASSSMGEYVPPFDRVLRTTLRREVRERRPTAPASWTPGSLLDRATGSDGPKCDTSSFGRPEVVFQSFQAQSAAAAPAANMQKLEAYTKARERLFGTSVKRDLHLPATSAPRTGVSGPRGMRNGQVSSIQVVLRYKGQALAVPIGDGLLPFLSATVSGTLKFKERTGPQWDLVFSLLQLEVARWFGGRTSEKGVREIVLSTVRR